MDVYPYDPEKRDRLLKDDAAVERAIQEAVRDALIKHKQMGLPIAIWKDNKVVWVPPEEIQVFDLPASPPD
jgi:hypothetical protein